MEGGGKGDGCVWAREGCGVRGGGVGCECVRGGEGVWDDGGRDGGGGIHVCLHEYSLCVCVCTCI